MKLDFTIIALTRFFNALGISASDQFVWAWGPYAPWEPSSGKKPDWIPWGSLDGTRTDFMRDLPRLRKLNRSVHSGGQNCSIFFRAPTGIVYIDDMTANGMAALQAEGVSPRAVIETSTGSYQVHLRVPARVAALDLYLAIQAKFGADPHAHPAANGLQTRYARLPGFRNTKPNRGQEWVKGVYTTRPEPPRSVEALCEIVVTSTEKAINTTPPSGAGAEGAQRRRSAPAAGDRQAGITDNSESGAEMRMAVHLAYRGVSVDEIARAIYDRRVARGKPQKDAMRNAQLTAKNAISWAIACRSR